MILRCVTHPIRAHHARRTHFNYAFYRINHHTGARPTINGHDHVAAGIDGIEAAVDVKKRAGYCARSAHVGGERMWVDGLRLYRCCEISRKKKCLAKKITTRGTPGPRLVTHADLVRGTWAVARACDNAATPSPDVLRVRNALTRLLIFTVVFAASVRLDGVFLLRLCRTWTPGSRRFQTYRSSPSIAIVRRLFWARRRLGTRCNNY